MVLIKSVLFTLGNTGICSEAVTIVQDLDNPTLAAISLSPSASPDGTEASRTEAELAENALMLTVLALT